MPAQILLVDPDDGRRDRRRAELSALGAALGVIVGAAPGLEQAQAEARRLPADYPSAVLLDVSATDGPPSVAAAALRSAAPAELVVLLLSDVELPPSDGIDLVLRRASAPSVLFNSIGGLFTNLASGKIEKFVVVLVAVQPLHPERVLVTGGTGCLVQTRAARFLLTAAHVARELSRRDVTWIMGGSSGIATIPPSPNLLGIDDALDIAAVQIPEDFSAESIGRVFYTPIDWPPARAGERDVAMTIGFPGEIREIKGGTIAARGMLLTSFVTAASRDRFVLTIDSGSVVTSKGRVPTKYGGVSGAPVFVSAERGISFAGVVREAAPFDAGVLGADGKPARRDAAFYATQVSTLSEAGTTSGGSDGWLPTAGRS